MILAHCVYVKVEEQHVWLIRTVSIQGEVNICHVMKLNFSNKLLVGICNEGENIIDNCFNCTCTHTRFLKCSLIEKCWLREGE